MRSKIKVGLDFDGVVAYNPFRIIRSPVSFIKRNIFGVKKLQFWYPKHKWEQIFWIILHESSVFPAKGVDFLAKLVKDGVVEAHLITARYSFLDDHLYSWLDKYKIRSLFKTVNLNKRDEQPHLFKEKIIHKYKLDYYVEDNWDIVRYLSQKSKLQVKSKKFRTEIYWIYNILDRFVEYPHKFPYLEKALEDIQKLLS